MTANCDDLLELPKRVHGDESVRARDIRLVKREGQEWFTESMAPQDIS